MKVIELSKGVAGAYCGYMLGMAGAQVTRVSGVAEDEETPDDLAIALACLNEPKAVARVDLDGDAGGTDLLAILSSADVLVEDLGAMALEGRNLSPNALREANPHLVVTRISEFGQTGPYADWAGSELVNLAMGGLLFLTGSWDRPPVQLAPYQAQVTAAAFAAIATLAAQQAAQGVTIDISKQESVAAMVAPALSEYIYRGLLPAREGKVGSMARIEHASDDWVYAGPASPVTADYKVFGDFLGIPELAEERFSSSDSRMEHWADHQALILPRLRERTAREWIDEAAEWRLTFGAVQSTTDLLECPVLREREFFRTLHVKGREVRIPAAPFLVNGERPTGMAAT